MILVSFYKPRNRMPDLDGRHFTFVKRTEDLVGLMRFPTHQPRNFEPCMVI